MYQRGLIILVATLTWWPLFSQGIRDSVFAIDQVMIKADRIFQKEEAGMKTTGVDTAILQAKVHLSLSDLLSENTTLFIKNHGRGALATASFRGTAASHTQVSWNGININSPMAGMTDFSMIPVYVVDQLKVRHGGASLADHGGGIGGSIHLENRIDWNEKSQVQYMQGIGSYSSFDEYLKASIGEGKLRSRTRIYHNYSGNDYTYVNRWIGNLDPGTGNLTHPLDTNSNAAYSKAGLLQEFYYRPKSNHLMTLFYWGQQAKRSIPRPTSYEGPNNDNLNNQLDKDHRVVTRWKYYSSQSTFFLRSGFAHKYLLYDQLIRVPGLGKIPSVWSESRQSSFFNTVSYVWEPLLDLSVEVRAAWDRHDVNTIDTISGTGYKGIRNEGSLFLAFRKGFADRLNLNMMVTQKWINGARDPITPFIGIDLRLLKERDFILKGSVSKNHHQPSLNDLFWQPGGNPDLKPEEGFSMDGGLEYKSLLLGQQVMAGISVYHSRISNWILWMPSFKGYWEPVNIREVLSRGLELDLHLNGRRGRIRYSFSGTYAYTSSINLGDSRSWGNASYGKQLVYIPLHSGNAMIRISYKDVYLTYQYNAYSERFTTSSNDLTKRDWLYPYFMNDIGLGCSQKIRKTTLSAEIKVYNLFNEVYHSILYRPMPGRNFHILVKLTI